MGRKLLQDSSSVELSFHSPPCTNSTLLKLQEVKSDFVNTLEQSTKAKLLLTVEESDFDKVPIK